MHAKRNQPDETGSLPAGCWRSPRGKLLSRHDQIPIQFLEGDLPALHRAIDVTVSHLDEGRGDEQRVPFAARLVRLQERAGEKDKILVPREDFHALHSILHVAAGHVDNSEVRGPDNRTAFIAKLSRIRKTIWNAIGDHDDVPEHERPQ